MVHDTFFFPLLGIVAGPLVVAVAMTLLETYRSDTVELGPIATDDLWRQVEVVLEEAKVGHAGPAEKGEGRCVLGRLLRDRYTRRP